MPKGMIKGCGKVPDKKQTACYTNYRFAYQFYW